MRKTIILLFLCIRIGGQAQEEVTNAFDDLKRSGTFTPQQSEMRQAASGDELKRLFAENPKAGFFCFTEDRTHDIQLTDSIPTRWVKRPVNERTQMKGICQPGEFYTWQIGIYSPYRITSRKDWTGW